MKGAGILEGDVVIMEFREARHGDIVAASIDGETTLKRYLIHNGQPYLRAANPKVRILAMEPAEAAMLSGEMPCCHSIEGVAGGYVPPLLRGAAHRRETAPAGSVAAVLLANEARDSPAAAASTRLRKRVARVAARQDDGRDMVATRRAGNGGQPRYDRPILAAGLCTSAPPDTRPEPACHDPRR